MTPASPADRDIVTEQLGRTPRGDFSIVARLTDGTPTVIMTYPAVRATDGSLEPFPTLYWLTEPTLCAEVGRLESDGWIARLEAGIAEDQTLIDRLREDHQRYRDRRWSMLTATHRAELQASGRATALRETGVGGITFATRGVTGLKCLHLHLAHHLAELNTTNQPTLVGELLTGLSTQLRNVADQVTTR
ncbi:MAG: DUF501 domain-containing protein [Phycisphaeraceae bacterium]